MSEQDRQEQTQQKAAAADREAKQAQQLQKVQEIKKQQEEQKKAEAKARAEAEKQQDKGIKAWIKKLIGADKVYGRKYIYTDKEIFQRTLEYVFPYKKEIKLLIFLVLATSVTQMGYPLGMTFVLQAIENESMSQLILVGFAVLGITLINYFVKKAYQYRIQIMGQRAMTDIRNDLFAALQSLSLDYYSEFPTGKIMSTLTNDVETVNELISARLIQMIGDVFTVVATFIAMVVISIHLTLVIIVLSPVFALIFIMFAKKTRVYWVRARKTIANITSILQETISGSKTIKAFATEERNIQIFDVANKKDRDTNLSAAKVNAFMQPVTQLVAAVGIIIIVYTGSALLQANLLSAPLLMGYVLLAMNFLTPLGNIGDFYQYAQSAFAGGERILFILDRDPIVKEKEDAIDLPPVEGYINYDDVSFHYVEGIPVLKNINIKLEPNTRLAFVGFTGAGKSTLISLLSRFYDPNGGRITIDGHDIRDVTLKSPRSQMGIVLQDTFLFSGTILDNIRYGKLDATEEEIVNAAKKVGAHKFILQLPEGYETNVRERGELLSIGQRQLIAFARALLADPPILILDEATSSVDPYTELKIQEGLEVLLENRNSFIIAHRLSTILNSDIICVIEEGEIIQRGSHDELIAEGGRYKQLYEMQFKKKGEKKK